MTILRCEKCGHEWVPRTDESKKGRQCSKCYSTRILNKDAVQGGTSTLPDYIENNEEIKALRIELERAKLERDLNKVKADIQMEIHRARGFSEASQRLSNVELAMKKFSRNLEIKFTDHEEYTINAIREFEDKMEYFTGWSTDFSKKSAKIYIDIIYERMPDAVRTCIEMGMEPDGWISKTIDTILREEKKRLREGV